MSGFIELKLLYSLKAPVVSKFAATTELAKTSLVCYSQSQIKTAQKRETLRFFKDEGLAKLKAAIGDKSLVLIGMMGAGKSTIGRRLAKKMGYKFVDADHEIEAAAGMKVPDIFEVFGEQAFRDGEKKVLDRLMREGPHIVATGGGAFLNEDTRRAISANGLSIWLRAELDVLMERVRRKGNRPLLLTEDPEGTMRRLLEERVAVYALADIVVESNDNSHDKVVAATIARLHAYYNEAPDA